ncbi:MAG TPA: glycolate oxidase subunit GlcF [Gammaproteobacteria bacterium]|nr:glycolate oxidase subunit GlcF [Gammaproteobacteria bacterium]
MQTNISDTFQQSAEAEEANAILRSCVHCGFCTATCPTYQLLGDELDGPRGRIYLIKQLLEGADVTAKTQMHLDRCLSCRSCETTCPSGVRYGRLVDIGRQLVEYRVSRPFSESIKRYLLRKIIPYPGRFSLLLSSANMLKPVLPAKIKAKIPMLQDSQRWPQIRHGRRMLILQGCAQSVVTANTNSATVRVLDKLGISVTAVKQAGCCGAVSHHLSAHDESLDFMRRNIDAWWSHIAHDDIEAIVVTASGCGVMIKEYGALLKHDPVYAEMAQRVSELAKDISEVVANENLSAIQPGNKNRKVAFHSPCTLQHGQKLNGVVETILARAGYELTQVADAHLCCGSAGTYSILQEKLSQQLLDNKLNALQTHKPDVIATANIGCQMHLATKAGVPVVHWIELLDM